MDIYIYFYIDTIFRPGLSRSSSGINYKSLKQLKMMKNIATSFLRYADDSHARFVTNECSQ